MIKNFSDIEELNTYYANSIMQFSTLTKNINDDILKKMLDNLMSDYKDNYIALGAILKFDKKLFLRRKKQEQRQEMQQFKFEMRKMRHTYWVKRKRNSELFKIYKQESDCAVKLEVKNENSRLNEMLKALSEEAKPRIERSTET